MSDRRLKYTLIDNNLRTNKDPYVIRMVDRHALSWDDIMKRTAKSSNYRAPLIEDVFRAVQETVTEVLTEGSTAETPMGKISPSIQGTFTRLDEKFNPKNKKNHRIKLNVSPNQVMEKRVRDNLKVKRIRHLPARAPKISGLENLSRSEKFFYPGDLTEIRGTSLFFNAENREEGIYFIDSKGNPFHPDIECNQCKGRLIFKFPDIPEGLYNIEVLCIRGSYGQIINGFRGKLQVKATLGSNNAPELNLDPNDTVATPN